MIKEWLVSVFAFFIPTALMQVNYFMLDYVNNPLQLVPFWP